MTPRKAPGNNRFEWTRDRLETLKLLLNVGYGPNAIANAMHCYSAQCVEYGKRRLAKMKPKRSAA